MSGLAKRVLRRLALAVPTFVGITLVTFALVHLAPGDPASVRAGEGRGATAEVVAENRRLAGLDEPLLARYLAWLGHSLTLDFGPSFVDGRPVRDRIAEALPQTLKLGFLATLLALIIAIPIGSFSALRDGRMDARFIDVALALAWSTPAAAVGLVMVRAGLPLVEGGGQSPSLTDLFAPALCLALPSVALLARVQRGALLGALASDFARTARAVGASPARMVLRHAFRHGLLPLVTVLGTLAPSLLSGSVIVERIFGVHGLGLLGYDALMGRDYATLMALASLSAVVTLAAVMLADVAALAIDPRLRFASRADEVRP